MTVRMGRYRLGRRVAVGGMAEVFLATVEGAAGFEKQVAVKRILPHLAADPEFVEMFLDEARVASGLSHANIAQVFDFAEAEGGYFIAMEWVHGRDLRRVGQAARERGLALTPARAAHVAREVARALQYAHGRAGPDGSPLGLVHRDVSPQNILVSFSGEVKLTDFGIAKAARRRSTTAAGLVKGKCAYMSPEQARGEPLDGRTDVFALGVVLWETLTGRALFTGDSDLAVLRAVQVQAVPPPSTVNAAVPPELDAVVARALEKDAQLRFPSAGALEAALGEVIFRHVRDPRDLELAGLMRALFPEEIDARPRGTARLPAAAPATPAPSQGESCAAAPRRFGPDLSAGVPEGSGPWMTQPETAPHDPLTPDDPGADRIRHADTAAGPAAAGRLVPGWRLAAVGLPGLLAALLVWWAFAGTGPSGSLAGEAGDVPEPGAAAVGEAPTAEPEQAPTAEPEQAPTAEPEQAPTAEPEQAPTAEPEQAPTAEPEQAPTAERAKAARAGRSTSRTRPRSPSPRSTRTTARKPTRIAAAEPEPPPPELPVDPPPAPVPPPDGPVTPAQDQARPLPETAQAAAVAPGPQTRPPGPSWDEGGTRMISRSAPQPDEAQPDAERPPVPAGAILHARLTGGVDTGDRGEVGARLTRSLIRDGQVLLPRGTALTGRAEARQGRVRIRFDRCLPPGGAVRRLRASAYGADGRIGVPSADRLTAGEDPTRLTLAPGTRIRLVLEAAYAPGP